LGNQVGPLLVGGFKYQLLVVLEKLAKVDSALGFADVVFLPTK